MTPLLFIKHKNCVARWIDNDKTILEDSYNVSMCNVNTTKGFGFFRALINQFYCLLFKVRSYSIIFIWFADYHSLLPVFFSKLFKIKSVIVIGGYDADEILTGSPKSLKEKFRKFCVSYSVKHATKLLPVSNVIKSYLLTVVNETKCEVIYNCVDTNKFIPPEVIQLKENLIVTVGGGGEFIKEAKRKRLDLFIQIGNEFNKRYPEYNVKFYAIGHNPDSNTYNYLVKLITSENVELKPMTKSLDELIEYYKNTSVYMQLSFYEAFGIAQVEAMLYGCIPVSNPGGAIGEVIGDTGFTVEDYNLEEYLKIIKEILDKKHEDLRIKAIRRAQDNFSLQNRKLKLLNVLNNLLTNS